MFYMNNPFDATGNTFLYGGAGNGAFIASSTDSNFCDFLIAAPVAASASTATLNGKYFLASFDILGNQLNQTRDTFFNATADGKGGFGNVTINGTGVNLSNAAQSQTSTGVTYTVNANGTGTITFPAPSGLAASNQLLSGAKNLLVAQDGSFFVAGGQSGFDLIVGVKALTGSATGLPSGLFFWGYLGNIVESDGTFTMYGAQGATNEVAVGARNVEIGHDRIQPDYTYAYDDTYAVDFTFSADGSVTYTNQAYAVGAGGNIIIGAGASTNYQVAMFVKAPTLTGTGVFLNPQGIVNQASYAPFTASVSPGEFLSLFGSGLAAQTTTASALPFPTTLGGVQVNITWVDSNGKNQTAQAPIYLVSPGQVSIVVPYTIPSDGTFLNFTVVNGTSSNTATVYSGPANPGIFTQTQNGLGDGAIRHTTDNSVVTTSNPAKIGETVAIYLTGMGAVSPAVTAGAGAPSNPLSVTILPDVYIDNVKATVLYSGLAPGLAGLYQLNVTIPSGVTTGGSVTIEVDCFDDQGYLLADNAQATIPISK